MSEPSTEKPETLADPKVIVFGMDESKKPHAAWFAEADAELAEKAAGFMRMKVLKVSLDDHRTVALQLPQGKVFASGKAFTPFIKLALYERLKGFEGAFEPAIPVVANDSAPQPEAPTHHRPATWAEIEVGSLVLANVDSEDGWYEAVVIEKKTDDLLILTWRDWPEYSHFVRTPSRLALLPKTVEPAPEVSSPSA